MKLMGELIYTKEQLEKIIEERKSWFGERLIETDKKEQLSKVIK